MLAAARRGAKRVDPRGIPSPSLSRPLRVAQREARRERRALRAEPSRTRRIMDCMRALCLALALAVFASSGACAPGAGAPRESATPAASATTAAVAEPTETAAEMTETTTETATEATEGTTEVAESVTEAEEEPLGLAPTEWLLPDGSRSGSLVYVDSHGDLRRVKYQAGPAAGPEGFHLEDIPVEDDQVETEAQASGMAPLILPAPKAVRRDPTPRPSDVFWRPKDRLDLKKPVPIRFWG